MAALRFSTPPTAMPELFRRLSPLAAPDLFEVEDCDDSGAVDHVIDRHAEAGDQASALQQEALR